MTRLPPRQQQALQLVAEGKSYKAIAKEMHISLETVKSHLKEVRWTYGGSTTYAVAQALREGVIR